MTMRPNICQNTIFHISGLAIVPPLAEKSRIIRNHAAERSSVDSELRLLVLGEGSHQQIKTIIIAFGQRYALAVAPNDILTGDII